MNKYCFKYSRTDEGDEYVFEHIEFAHTAADALVQFRANVIEHLTNQRLVDVYKNEWKSCIQLFGMRTLSKNAGPTADAKSARHR